MPCWPGQSLRGRPSGQLPSSSCEGHSRQPAEVSDCSEVSEHWLLLSSLGQQALEIKSATGPSVAVGWEVAPAAQQPCELPEKSLPVRCLLGTPGLRFPTSGWKVAYKPGSESPCLTNKTNGSPTSAGLRGGQLEDP